MSKKINIDTVKNILIIVLQILTIAQSVCSLYRSNQYKDEIDVLKSQLYDAEQKNQEIKTEEILENNTESKTGLSIIEIVYIDNMYKDSESIFSTQDLEKYVNREGNMHKIQDTEQTIEFNIQNDNDTKLVIQVENSEIKDIYLVDYSDTNENKYEITEQILEHAADAVASGSNDIFSIQSNEA